MPKNIKQLLTWRNDGSDRWTAKEYGFKIYISGNYQVRHYDLYDGDKKYDNTFYALINAQNYAKNIYKNKIKRSKIQPYQEPPKVESMSQIESDTETVNFNGVSQLSWSPPPVPVIDTYTPNLIIDSVSNLANAWIS